MLSEKDSFQRLEDWVAWRLGHKLTHDERQQLLNLVRGIFTAARDQIGEPL